MHAFFYARPLRRRPIVTAALISAGAHAALLFGFSKGPVVPPPVLERPEGPPPIIITDDQLVPPPPPAPTNKSAEDVPQPTNSMTHARISEPPAALNPQGVTIEYRFDPGQLPNPNGPTNGIPITEIWGPGKPGEKIWDIKDLEKRPESVVQVAPDYPFTAKSQGLEGVVVVRFVVTPAGAVESATIVSSPHSLFSDAALHAVKRWTFRAGMKHGAKVATRMEIPLTFRLNR